MNQIKACTNDWLLLKSVTSPNISINFKLNRVERRSRKLRPVLVLHGTGSIFMLWTNG